MKKGLTKSLSMILLTVFVLALNCLVCFGAEAVSAETVDGADNAFFAGETANFSGGAHFAGYGAGYNVGMSDTTLTGDAAIAGYNVNVNSCEIGDSVYLAGYNVSVEDTKAEGNLMMAGFSLSVDEDTSVKSAVIAGSVVKFAGEADCITITADKVIISGTVNGDANISASEVIIESGAVIEGELNVSSSNEASINSGATVNNYNFEQIVENEEQESGGVSIAREIFNRFKSALYWSAAMIIVSMLMCLFAKDSIEYAVELIKTRTGIVLGSGAITIVALPVAFVIAMVTFIGIPVALITAGIAAIISCISVAFAGTTLSRLVFKNMNPYLASALGVLILEFAKKIPFIGGLIFWAAAVYTFGFFVQRLYLLKLKK